MRKFLWLVVFISSPALAQKMNIIGHVVDSLGSPLSGATVIVLKPTDSTLVNFCVTNGKGAFNLNGLSRSSYLLKVTFVGQRTYSASVNPPLEGNDVQLGTIRMRESKTQLDEV